MAGPITVRDKDIISKSFRMLTHGAPPSDLLEQLNWDKQFNVFSSAIGDNRHLNPIPQWSPATDPRYGRLMHTREGGMGTMYKTMFDDNATTLTLVAGVPQFAGLLSFITNMFDPEAAIMANKGRTPSVAFYLGQAAGSLAFWPMQVFSIGLQFLQFIKESPKNSFYTVKPTMGMYIMSANGVLNDVLVKLGYINPVLPSQTPEQTDPLHGRQPPNNHSATISSMNNLFPDTVNADGTIDLMRLVMRGTRKYRHMIHKLAAMDDQSNAQTPEQKDAEMQKLMEQVQFDQTVTAGKPSAEYSEREMKSVGQFRNEEGGFTETDSSYLNVMAAASPDNTQLVQPVNPPVVEGEAPPTTVPPPPVTPNPNETPTAPAPVTPAPAPPTDVNYDDYYMDNVDDRSWLSNITDLLQTAAYGGLDAVTWRVESSGSVTDSFSNSMTRSPLADKFNSVVKAANDFRFDVAGGQTGIGVVDKVMSMATELGTGVLSGTVVGNIPLALANNAYIKVPDHWETSSVNLHKETFSLNFRCNYAHPYEYITKIWIPFALIIPMVAGFSTGGSSFTSPFMIRAFSKSKTFIRTGMVESARLTFGEGDAGWTRDRKPLNLKIDLDIIDLDPLVAVPIKRGITLMDLSNPAAAVKRMFADDTAYNSYLARLTGMDYLDTVLKYSRINRMLTNASLDIKQSFRSSNIAAKVNDSIVMDFAKLFHRPIAR